MPNRAFNGKRVSTVHEKRDGSFFLTIRETTSSGGFGVREAGGLDVLLKTLEKDAREHPTEPKVLILGPSLFGMQYLSLAVDLQHALDAEKVYARNPGTGRLREIIVTEERIGSSLLKHARWRSGT